MEINLLVKSLVHQIPSDIKTELEDKGTHFILRILNPSEKFNRYFKKYYREGSNNEIDIFNNDYQKLIDLSIVLKRYAYDSY